MFVEKLTKDDFIDFIKNFTFKGDNNSQIVYDFENINDYNVNYGKTSFSIPNKIYLHSNRYLNHCNRTPNGEKTEIENITNFEFTDFDFIIIKDLFSFRSGEKANSLKFMYSKFGPAYKKAFFKYREAEKTNVLKEAAETFDDNTRNIAKKFDCGKE